MEKKSILRHFAFMEIILLLSNCFLIFFLLYKGLTNNKAFDVIIINNKIIIALLLSLINYFILYKYLKFLEEKNGMKKDKIILLLCTYGLIIITININLIFPIFFIK